MFQTLRFIQQIRRLVKVGTLQPDQLAALQQRRLRQLLRHAFERSPFYRRTLRGLDLEHCPLSAVPPLTKKEMMANFDDIVTDPRIRRRDIEHFVADPTNLGRYYLDQYVVCHTSGSQGQPALIVQEPQDVHLTLALQIARGNALPKNPLTVIKRLIRPARWSLVTLKPDFYPSAIAFSYMSAAARRLVRLQRLSLFDPLAETVAKLNDFQPDYLTGYAGVLQLLAREEQAGRLRLRAGAKLRQITNISEPLSNEVRNRLTRTFGVHVSNQYGMGECMHLSCGCPVASCSHVNADLAILEVVDDDYQPVSPGSPGTKILVTNLVNKLQPFIRYEIDDVVTMRWTPCPCGSNLPAVEAVGGRAHDKFWADVGGVDREVPAFVFRVGLQHCLEIADYQVLQTGCNRFVLKVAPVPGETIALERLRAMVEGPLAAEGLGQVVKLEVQVVEAIQPDPRSGKSNRFQNLFGQPANGVLSAQPLPAA